MAKHLRKPKIIISWWLSFFQLLLVKYVKVNEQWIADVKAAANKGPVIFVLRNRNLIEFLCLRGLCHKHNLPQVGFVAGISPFLFLPFWRWVLVLFRARHPERQRQRLEDTLASGGSAIVFLSRPAIRDIKRNRPVALDGIRLAVEVQQKKKMAIQVLPTVFLWGENAMRRIPRTIDFVFGTNDHPRLLRSLWLLIRRHSVHGTWVANPIDISKLNHGRSKDASSLAGAVRSGAYKGIEILRRNRLGSLTKPSSRIKAELLNSPRLLKELDEISKKENIPQSEIIPRTKNIIEKMATDFKPSALTFFAVVMAFVWRRIYTGIDIREKDKEKFREAMAKGSLLILPDHKSHIDYLVVSQAMTYTNIMLPHIAAGDNLSFWPIGWLFRSSGAFFIRRSFVNDRFYTAIINGYIRKLIKEGYAIEVFIEGGRSRTGKLLRPKIGMLEMALKAIALLPGANLGVLPTFIGYEKVIEEDSYLNESRGKKKKSENVSGLIKTTQVLLHKYGRLYLRVGEYFSVDDILAEQKLERKDLLIGSHRRNIAIELAVRTLNEINRNTIVTPSAVLATALLTENASTIKLSHLKKQVIWLVNFLATSGASLSKTVSTWISGDDELNKDSLEKAITVFVKHGRITSHPKKAEPQFSIKPDKRPALDYYKNNTIHFFAPSSIISAICLSNESQKTSRDQLIELFALACRIYRWEFFLPEYKADEVDSFLSKVQIIVDKAVTAMTTHGILESDEVSTTVKNVEKAIYLKDILRNYHEIYLATLITCKQRILGEITGETTRLSRSYFTSSLKENTFTKPEGNNKVNSQNALQACKDLKLNRPTSDEKPFDEGELGDRLIQLLTAATSVPKN